VAIAINDIQDRVSFKQPILAVGIGGIGSKLAINSSTLLDCKCVLISNDKKDLDENHHCIFVRSDSCLNPSSYRLRSLTESSASAIKMALEGFRTVLVFANLAGRAGTAMAPVVCREAKLSCSSTTVSIAIMPFRFEKDRIFQAGVSLNRLQTLSDSIIVVDNDSLMDNNPELSTGQCYEIVNHAIYDVISSTLKQYVQPDTSLLCTSDDSKSDAESSVKNSLAMLAENIDLASVKKAVLHVVGGQKVKLGVLDSLANNLYSVFDNDNFDGVSMCISNSDETKTHLVASIRGATKFDKYDPLAQIIPTENVLDWEEMDSSPDIEMTIPNLE
jgi:cell division protein FtsZ